MSTATPRPPAGLGRVGAGFWRKVITEFDPSTAEQERLLMLCRLKDRIAAEEALIAAEGLVVEGSQGQPRPHPMLSQLRADQRLADQLLARLELVDEAGETIPTGRQARSQAGHAARRWGGRRPHRKVTEMGSRRAAS